MILLYLLGDDAVITDVDHVLIFLCKQLGNSFRNATLYFRADGRFCQTTCSFLFLSTVLF
jgi:hypothetical protein